MRKHCYILLLSLVTFFACSRPENLYVAVKPGAILRESASATSDPIKILAYGTQVRVTNRQAKTVKMFNTEGRWLQLEHEGSVGWVYSSLLMEALDGEFLLVNGGHLTIVPASTPEWIQTILLKDSWQAPLDCSPKLKEDLHLANCEGDIQFTGFGAHTNFTLALFPGTGESYTAYKGKPGSWAIQDGQLVLLGSRHFQGNNYNFNLKDCVETSAQCSHARISISFFDPEIGPQRVLVSRTGYEEASCKYECWGPKSGSRPISQQELTHQQPGRGHSA